MFFNCIWSSLLKIIIFEFLIKKYKNYESKRETNSKIGFTFCMLYELKNKFTSCFILHGLTHKAMVHLIKVDTF
jgi:hypothetical protein